MWLYFNPLANRPWLLRIRALKAADVAAHLYYYAAGAEDPALRLRGKEEDDGSLTWTFHNQPPINVAVGQYGDVIDWNVVGDPTGLTMHLVARATLATGPGQNVPLEVTLEQDGRIIGGTVYVSVPGGAEPTPFADVFDYDAAPPGGEGAALLECELVFHFGGAQ